jgi:class 3 adenylate cyclase
VVTFLLTDIEGSTGRWETDADLMRKALAALALMLSGLEAEHGDRMAACDYFHRGRP